MSKAAARLKRLDADLAAVLVDLEDRSVKVNIGFAVYTTLREVLGVVRNLSQLIERSHFSPNKETILALINDERMRLASQLNVDICGDLEAGRIRTDQKELSNYLLVLNRAMQEVDGIFGGRTARN